ncbi:serine/threonine-protein kinase [Kribbella voronezhensis]|uniref:non-specific serine/threonine protein kinase n=1 Tax=Kribbella voronezhensis TaxID=2512212 RepID=A0A4R7T0G2_9ACTN|nr:serine/threonine-protein kinase [Kribbella voronezhensis]TDU84327.1 serine/threonine-protein kinase [Kribbella voronezhensis]
MPDVFAGRFELIDPVGSGGAGTVWRAWDRRLDRLCAAKVLRQRHAGALLRFVREQGLRLEHPNVLSPYSWAAEDDQALLAMDLVGGGSLSHLVADFGALPERYAAELLAQVLTALEHVHGAGVVHRDVKPANLLLEATGTALPVLRLSDFGIAFLLGEPRLTQQGAVVGTPGFVAPEVLAGEPPGVAQDLYAAGVTGWQLLTGEEPPPAGPLPPRLEGSAGRTVWDVVEGLVRVDPAQRTSSATAALKALAPALADPLQLPAHTTDGELIEVFNHLPSLPPPYEALPAPPQPNANPPEQTHESSRVGPASNSGRRRLVLAGVAGVAAAGVVAVLLLNGSGGGGSPSPGSAPTTASTSTRKPSVTPETIPTGPVTPAPNPQVTLGGSCGWQEAGGIETTADGTRVECRQQGSSYRWVKAG